MTGLQAHPRATRAAVAVAAIVLLAVALLAGVAQAAVSYDTEELAFLERLNQYRIANGRQPLLLSDQLSATGEQHARDMGTYGFFSHVTERSQRYAVGSEFWERLEHDGYNGSASSGENLAAGVGSGAEVFELWKDSSGHRANMLDPTVDGDRLVFKEIGVARVFVPGSPYGWYWATEFGGTLDPTAHDPSLLGPPGPFPDVSANHPFVGAIRSLSEAGIITGYGDGTFRPQDVVWRQHFAKMIVETLDLPVDESDEAPFSDVEIGGPDTLYPDNYIACVATYGITVGVAPGQFAPTSPISRAQVATMVVRAVKKVSPGVLESPPAGYVSPWGGSLDGTVHGGSARLAGYNGLLDGLFVSTDDPWAGMPRGEVAQVLYNVDVLLND